MKIMAIDCSAGPASVAIVEFDGDAYKVIANGFRNEGLTHSQTLVPMIDEALKEANASLSDVDYFAINAGPGSFTGVRIGVAALKGLTCLDSANCIPVSTLESMAYNYYGNDEKVTVCACMDARCNQTYTATFEVQGNNVTRISNDSAIMIEELGENLKTLNKKVIFVGDGASLCYNILNKKIPSTLATDDKVYQNAVSVALCAKQMMDKGFTPIPSSKLLPVYLRAPQAERELKKRG